MAQIEVWSDLHQDIKTDSRGNIKKVTNIESVNTSIDNILRTYPSERCLAKGTSIKLLNGKYENIENLVGLDYFWVYSYDIQRKCIIPGKAKAFKTGKKKVIKITLNNNKTIICTKDHKFLMLDKKYKEAQDLKLDDSLMPLYFNRTAHGYEQIFDIMTKRWILTHKVVGEYKYGDIESSKVIHHKNIDKVDNSPENLCLLDKVFHFKYHSKKIKNLCKKLWYSKEYEYFRENVKTGKYKYRNIGRDEFCRRISKGIINHLSNEKNKKIWSDRCSERAKITFSKPEVVKKLQEIGKRNGTSFWNDPKMIKKRKYNLKKWKEGYSNWSKTEEASKILGVNGKKVGKDNIYSKFRKEALPLLENGILITEDIWNNIRKMKSKFSGYPLWETIISRKFMERLNEEVKINHKIKCIEFLNNEEEVYDISVEKYHNFALSAGVFVHNCMLPEFASSLANLMFEPITDNIQRRIAADMKRVIEAWDDRPTITGVDFFSDPDRNFISLVVNYRLQGYERIFQYTMNVDTGGE